MGRVCIVFESRYGQSQRIAERVGALAAACGHEVILRRAALAYAADLQWASAVVLVAPVYDRKHAREVTDLAVAHRQLLATRPTALFSVSLAAALGSKRLAQHAAGQLVREFLVATGLQPVTTAAVAGGLNYPAYPPGLRFGMRLGALVMGLPTDTSRAHDLTDWTQVERVADEFLRSPVVAAPQPAQGQNTIAQSSPAQARTGLGSSPC